MHTGSIYNDPDLRNKGFAEHVGNSSVVGIKTHQHWDNRFNPTRPPEKIPFLVPPFEKAIVMVRNPYEAILAE